MQISKIKVIVELLKKVFIFSIIEKMFIVSTFFPISHLPDLHDFIYRP